MASATDQAPGLLKRFAAAVEAGSVGEDEEDLLVELKVREGGLTAHYVHLHHLTHIVCGIVVVLGFLSLR